MAIQINGNGTITGISSGGLPAGSVTSATLADGAASGTKLTMPTGSVIQIVEGSTTTSQSPTGQNYVLFLQKDITPSATANSVFVTAVIQYGLAVSNQDEGLGFKLTRTVGGTETTLYESDDPYDVYNYESSGAAEMRAHKPIQFLDTTISTTSAATYKLYARDYSSANAYVCTAGAKSTIHLLEIKG